MSNDRNRRVVGYLLFNEIAIENANALSGNLVYGIPAVTGIKGAFHAMSRKLLSDKKTSGMKVALRGVMIACHDHKVLAARSKNFKNYRFMQQKPSVATKGDLVKMNSGVSPSIIEQAYCSLTMSFIVEVVCDRPLNKKEKALLESETYKIIQHNRIAGGTVVPFRSKARVAFVDYDDLDDVAYQISRSHVLVDATDTLQSLLEDNKDMTATDVLIEASSIKWSPVKSEINGHVTEWVKSRLGSDYGWVVPITNGYQSVSRQFLAGELENSRHSSSKPTKSCYVEAVYTLGRWVNPHTLRVNDDMRNAFWCYEHQPENSLYLVKTNNITNNVTKGIKENV